MAQSGYTPLSLYYSSTSGVAPTSGNLVSGELAINITDGKLYFKNTSGAVTLLASAAGAVAATNLSGGTSGQIPYQNGVSSTTFMPAPGTSGTYLGYNGSGFYWSTSTGASGYSGYSGGTGTNGTSGYSGISGYSGVSGYSGFSGISGFSGSGVSGYSGSGTSGFSGYSGVSGLSGFSGFSGYSGSGTSGYSGINGSTGPTGNSGYSGFSGYSGIDGASGTNGLSGYSGRSGFSGYSGSGVSGYSGYSGLGLSGYSGYSGATAASGYSGYSGTNGVSGYSGISGANGASGTSGYSGVNGASGYSGFSGISGYSGSTAYTATNLSGGYVNATSIQYSATLTGGTGIVNLGSGQFYKDASGNVSIGSTSTPATLYVKGGNSNNLSIDNGGQQFTTLSLYNNGTEKAQMYWDQTNTLFVFGTDAGAPVVFKAATVERMRISTAGGVSIGTNTDAGVGNLLVNGNVTGANFITNGSTAFTITQSGTKLLFKYGATTIASLDSSGNFIALANVTAYGTP